MLRGQSTGEENAPRGEVMGLGNQPNWHLRAPSEQELCINPDGQFGGIWSHLGDMILDMSEKEVLEFFFNL